MRRIWVLLCFAILFSAEGLAEVGITRPAGNDPVSIINVGIITDDPDPLVGYAWQRLRPDSADRRILNDEGYLNGDGEPAIVRQTLTGIPLVAWAKNSPSGFDIVLSRFENDVWTAPQVLAGTAADELDPVLAVNPLDGTVHLLYWIEDGTPRIMHRQAPSDLSTWTTPVQVSLPGEISARPAATFFAGALRVVFEVHDLGYNVSPKRIVIATDDGQGFSSMTLSTTLHDGKNWPKVHGAAGRMWVDWVDADNEMCWIREEQPGIWDSELIEPFSTVEEREYHVRGEIRFQATD